MSQRFFSNKNKHLVYKPYKKAPKIKKSYAEAKTEEKTNDTLSLKTEDNTNKKLNTKDRKKEIIIEDKKDDNEI